LNSDNPLVSDWWLRTAAIATQSHGLKVATRAEFRLRVMPG